MWRLRKDVLRLLDIMLECWAAIAQTQRNIETVNDYAGGLEERIDRLENLQGLKGRKLLVKTKKKK